MNWLLLLQVAPLLFKLIPKGQQVITEATDNESAAKNIKDALVGGYEILEEIGAQFFPGVLPHLQPLAAMTALSSDIVRYVQKGLNKIDNAGLEVDGHFGDLTKEAVENYQRRKGISPIDGWPGEKTRANIGMDLAQLK